MIGPVIDCSVTAAWILSDERSVEADAALDRVTAVGGVAPWLWWAEMRNVCLVAERRGRMTDADTAAALTELQALGFRLDHAPDSATALRLARTHDLTLYDALYLELAIREARPLATLDRRLATAFKAEDPADTRPKA